MTSLEGKGGNLDSGGKGMPIKQDPIPRMPSEIPYPLYIYRKKNILAGSCDGNMFKEDLVLYTHAKSVIFGKVQAIVTLNHLPQINSKWLLQITKYPPVWCSLHQNGQPGTFLISTIFQQRRGLILAKRIARIMASFISKHVLVRDPLNNSSILLTEKAPTANVVVHQNLFHMLKATYPGRICNTFTLWEIEQPDILRGLQCPGIWFPGEINIMFSWLLSSVRFACITVEYHNTTWATACEFQNQMPKACSRCILDVSICLAVYSKQKCRFQHVHWMFHDLIMGKAQEVLEKEEEDIQGPKTHGKKIRNHSKCSKGGLPRWSNTPVTRSGKEGSQQNQ